jgi:hypothetical protein
VQHIGGVLATHFSTFTTWHKSASPLWDKGSKIIRYLLLSFFRAAGRFLRKKRYICGLI